MNRGADFQEAGKTQGARVLDLLGRVYASSGRREETTKILDDLESQTVQPSPTIPFPHPLDITVEIGLVHLGLGSNQLALAWLEKAADERVLTLFIPSLTQSRRGYAENRGTEHCRKRIGLDH